MEDIYYGNIIPCDRQIAPGSNLERAMDQAQKCEEKLVSQLEGTQESLLLNLINAQDDIYSTMVLENFILGLRLGMRLAMEVMDEDDGDLTAVKDGRQ
ncbi:DUF6809 family protein [uncultured Dysosmobacter sp.]|uniref:DUF6809 family protein n=1 Tax=uncultured Dysosmobacter sp. TaxID=2591384 RepID=UPI0034379654